MDGKFETSLMVKAAEMYYLRGMKQEEIARELKIARSTISVILNAARDAGIIEIRIHDPQLNHHELSRQIQTHFNLYCCLVVPTALQNPDNLRKIVAQRAIQYFNSMITTGMTIGVAWGRTCSEFINIYSLDSLKNDISVVPLIGGSSQNAPYFQLNEMVRRFAAKLQGKVYFIHAPANNASLAEKSLFVESSMMRPILEQWSKLDIILTGIGSPPSIDQNRREQFTGESEIYGKASGNVVGDLCARYFDETGKFITTDVFERILSIPIQNLHKAGQVIAMASGVEKARAICGALRTGVVDTLITDEQTAQAVCQMIIRIHQDSR